MLALFYHFLYFSSIILISTILFQIILRYFDMFLKLKDLTCSSSFQVCVYYHFYLKFYFEFNLKDIGVSYTFVMLSSSLAFLPFM